MKLICYLTLLTCLSLINSGCSHTGRAKNDNSIRKTLTVYGSGATDSSKNNQQQTFYLQHNARADAYRQLAARLFTEPLNNDKTVAEQIIANEQYRIYLDTFLREAKISEDQAIGNHYFMKVSLPIPERFYQCMSGDALTIKQCLKEDNKLPITRTGYYSSNVKQVNLACLTIDCSDQFHIKGFIRNRNAVDQKLLNAGLENSQWWLNTSSRILMNFYLLKALPH